MKNKGYNHIKDGKPSLFWIVDHICKDNPKGICSLISRHGADILSVKKPRWKYKIFKETAWAINTTLIDFEG